MPPRRKRAAAEAPEFIDLTGDAQPAPKRPNLSSSQSRGSSGATGRQAASSSSSYPSTQEPDYLDLTQEDDALDRELYGTFGSFAEHHYSVIA